jgi:hypothetical protein
VAESLVGRLKREVKEFQFSPNRETAATRIGIVFGWIIVKRDLLKMFVEDETKTLPQLKAMENMPDDSLMDFDQKIELI